MTRSLHVTLAAGPRAPSQVRFWITQLCAQWGLESLCDDLKVATSELVTNAVLHAGTPLSVTVRSDLTEIRVTVHDESSEPPQVRPGRMDLIADLDRLPVDYSDDDPRHHSTHSGPSGSTHAGRGLLLVHALSTTWGTDPATPPPGKDVWFTLRVPQAGVLADEP